MKRTLWATALAAAIASLDASAAANEQQAAAPEQPPPPTEQAGSPIQDILVVVGAGGTSEFTDVFAEAAAEWTAAANEAEAACTVVGLEPEDDSGSLADRDRVHQWLEAVQDTGTRPLWFVYIGHGTYDGRQAKLNLRGADITAEELRDWLAPQERPLVVVLGNSASGPFLPLLSGPNRIVITATTTGDEINYARFGALFAGAIADPGADIDQDGQTSVLEAFVTTAQRVARFYSAAGRMASEHPLLDDNGDRRGTPPDWFNGVRLVQEPEGDARADGANAHRIVLVENEWERSLTSEQRRMREEIEAELETLRARKSDMFLDDYLRELEIVLRRLAPVYVPETMEPEPAPEPETSEDAKQPPATIDFLAPDS